MNWSRIAYSVATKRAAMPTVQLKILWKSKKVLVLLCLITLGIFWRTLTILEKSSENVSVVKLEQLSHRTLASLGNLV